MTAHSPLATSPDQVPEPGAVEAAQRETRRLIDMSRGIGQVAVGIACLALAGLYLQTWRPIDGTILLILLPLIVVGAGVITTQAVVRARKRAGIPNVTLRAQNSMPARQRWLLGAMLALGAVLGFSMFFLPDGMELLDSDTLPFMLFTVVVALPLAWRGMHLGLWEDILVAAGFPLGYALMMLQTGPERIGWLCLGLGATQLIAGYCLHRRWQAWVRSLPPPAENATNSGVAA